MDWCPVEWPLRPATGSVAKLHKKQSGKKATLAGLTGIIVLLIMAATVFGYALWAKRINVSRVFVNAKAFAEETIYGQVPVILTVDGKGEQIKTKSKTVQEFLTEQGILIKQEDKVEPALTALLQRDMKIKVVRVEKKEEIKQIAVPFTTKRVADAEMPKGFARRVKAGKEGLEEQIWHIRLEDGIEVSRACVARKIINEPVEGIIRYGTLSTISRGGQQVRFSRAFEMLATGYSYTGYNTATGAAPKPGVAAVDPKVIPLGTRLYIDGYGNAVALDTGGLIKGQRIDLFYETDKQALQWGARRTKVYVLE